VQRCLASVTSAAFGSRCSYMHSGGTRGTVTPRRRLIQTHHAFLVFSGGSERQQQSSIRPQPCWCSMISSVSTDSGVQPARSRQMSSCLGSRCRLVGCGHGASDVGRPNQQLQGFNGLARLKSWEPHFCTADHNSDLDHA